MINPSTDPVGTVRDFPRWEEPSYRTYSAHCAVRWTDDRDEEYPWLLLGSEGPQRLSHDAVEGCRVIGAVPGTPAAEPIGHDVELVDKLAKASWDAADGFMSGVPWPPNSWRVEKERRRVRAMLAAYLDHPWFIGQEVEWNPRDDVWTSGVVDSLTENTAVVVFHDSSRFVIEKRHLRPALRSTVEGDIHG